MGICLLAYAVSDANLRAIEEDPLLVWRVVSPDDEAPYLEALKASARPSLMARLLGKRRPPPAPRPLPFLAHEMRVLDLDKSWDGINYVLKGLVPQAPGFFDSELEAGDVDVGMGPALLHRSATMSEIAAAVGPLGEKDIVRAFDATDFDGVYLDELWMRRDQEAISYLTMHFAEFQAFVAHTARHGLGAVIQFT